MKVEEQLLRMLDNIAVNAGYPRYLESKSSLVDPQIYFDICQIIFPELSIKLIKIQEYRPSTPTQKLQFLIDLLSKELQINLSDISADAIMKYDFEHIHKFLDLLLQYSKMYMESMHPSKKRVNSDPANNNSEEYQRQPKSARVPERHQNEDSEKSQAVEQAGNGRNRGNVIRKQSKKKKYAYSAKKKRARSEKKQRANVHQEVVKIIMDEKNRALRASMRDNRKNKNEDINSANLAYKTYLKNYRKQNVSRKNREGILEEKSQAARAHSKSQLPLRDLTNIDCFFESFATKFRDQKQVYLRKMQQQIRKKDADRYCFKNRIERETKRQMEDLLKLEIQAAKHQHDVKTKLLKQKSEVVATSIGLMKKESNRRLIEEKKELKAAKKKQIQKIENYLKQENEKVLMALQSGGRLQKVIMELYKRF